MTKQTYILAFLIFILSTGGFTAMPLFPLLTDVHNISLTQASGITATYILMQKVTPIVLGPIGDYFGYKRMSVSGEWIRGIGFIGVGCVSNYYLLLLFALLAGLGGGFASPSLQSLIMKSSTYNARAKVSSLRATATSAGLLLGPIIAGIVIWTGNFQFIFVFAGSLYLVGAFLLIVFVTSTERDFPKKKMSIQSILEALRNKGYIKLIILMLMFYILVAQLFVTLPEYAKQFTEHIQALFLINGTTGLLLQYPVGVLISKYNKSKVFMFFGITSIFLSFVTLALWNNFLMLFVAVFLFTVGEILILPIVETSIANFSDRSRNMGLYFGMSNLSDGIGRPFGSLLGGWLVFNLHFTTVWVVFSGLTFLMLLFYILFFRRFL
ncbi:MFS transporter [Ornithinibacillus bavariensis]|uniref:MFS transporter n=1 Tax=Ornithinibacillus bavariensis TaxID=545502 RepID=A0A919X8U6_9BACI|nr:MFS transporter [Ornithinibacillus bavariensis]GIO27964.1 MFS transporter [Ornithinibacillus bavariensis]